ncbi:MAG: hypothetical protein Q9220_002397 [cf. Caloplaca sp. 1 TL-2023]
MSLVVSYPWVKEPIIISAPMRMISFAPLAIAVSRAGGIGFIGAGSDLDDLESYLHEAAEMVKQNPIRGHTADTLPIGVGFLNWGADLHVAVREVEKFRPAAVWLFAAHKNSDLVMWTQAMRKATQGQTKVWIQRGSVGDAVEIAKLCSPDVIVVQGSDAGGHGLERGAGIVSLLPEVADALRDIRQQDISVVAGGGIVDGRGVTACLALGAEGVVLGTRFLASTEARIAKGYQDHVLQARDGGINTVRTKVYDQLRGTTGWPDSIGGRSIINQSFHDAKDGQISEENRKAHAEALEMGDLGWGESGRLTTYAGTGVGLIKQVQPAKDIIEEIRKQVDEIESRISRKQSKV